MRLVRAIGILHIANTGCYPDPQVEFMPLTPEIMLRVLPEQPPPWEPRSAEEARKAQLLVELDGGLGPLSRGYFWQKYITEQLREARSWLSDSLTALAYPNPLLQQAVGYIEIDASFATEELVRRASRGTGYFFGAIVYDHRGESDGFRALSRDIGSLSPESRGITAVRMAAADIHHAPHPVGATATCWTSKRGSGGWIRDVLTAKHVVSGFAVGQNVAMAGGSFGILRDFCEASVDAALIEPPNHTHSYQPLGLDIDPSIGSDVTFTGANSTQRSGKITRTWVFPSDGDAYDPQRVHFDFSGVQGDSGALVRLTSTGDAVGIYTGIKCGKSTQAGMAQAIWQATELLDVDLFE